LAHGRKFKPESERKASGERFTDHNFVMNSGLRTKVTDALVDAGCNDTKLRGRGRAPGTTEMKPEEATVLADP
jgi:hypothetical protein